MNDNTEKIICFDIKVKIFFLCLFISLFVLTFFKINGSSIEMINILLGIKGHSNVLIGTPKPIRVDEWAINTPAILSQYNKKEQFSATNYSLGYGKAPLFMNIPVKHWSTIFRPQYWFFFIADIETAFAFYWNMKMVFLLGGIFLLLMLITENNFIISLLGSFWVFFSGYIQWWYSSPQMWPEMIGCFAIITVSFIYMLLSKKNNMIFFSSLVFIIFSINFIMFLYPPHQITFIYLSAFIIVGVVLPRYKNKKLLDEKNKDCFRLLMLIMIFFSLMTLLFILYSETKETLKVFSETVYPGKRRSYGGNGSIIYMFSGFFGILMSETNFPYIWGNVCESSNFFMFFPVLIILFFYLYIKTKRLPNLHIAFMLYTFIILSYFLFGFPKLFARITLFDRVTANRAIMACGIANILWTCVVLNDINRGKIFLDSNFKKYLMIIVSFILSIIAATLPFFIDRFKGFSILPYQILLCCLIIIFGILFLLKGKIIPFFAIILIPNIFYHALVNPVCIGLKPIFDNPFYKKVRQIVQIEPDSKWIVYGNSILANLFYTTGARVFNGPKYIPNLEEMKIIGLDDEDKKIYNRYAYLALEPSKKQRPYFRLVQTDYYRLYLNPDNDIWNKLNINYAFLPSDIKYRNKKFLETIEEILIEDYKKTKKYKICQYKKNSLFKNY